ncbi:Hypp3621 [Branchiostoma lanceolatum]|uniref:Hypp3621 protein n=1 Tax=Branchiostoma lanceolatum TaxID=7740 RepID=A0A8K0EUI5_BRALA|nr:Hypp3621 [Branchiostoma lanceolatum]
MDLDHINDHTEADSASDQSLVQYGTDRCAQLATLIQRGDLPLTPYVAQPVVYKVYNINNPVGIQIEIQGSSMSVDDTRKSPEQKQTDSQEMATQTGIPETRFTLVKPVPKPTSCKRLDIVSQQIIARMEELEEEGKWHNYDRFYRKACSYYVDDPDILIQIVFENVVAAYYRNDLKDGQQSILRGQELIFRTQNPLHHQGNMLYLKAALFRKEKKVMEAENALVLARQALEQMLVGRDTGEIWYNVAALFAQALNDECTESLTSDFKAQATEAFQLAKEHYRQGGDEDESCRNKLRRAHIRHAMFLLGCWSEVRPTNRSDDVTEDDLRQAVDSLDEVERNLWEGIPKRMRYYWYLARSDLFRYKNSIQRALEMAEEALRIAKESQFPSEVHFAEDRVKLLSKLVSGKPSLNNDDSKSNFKVHILDKEQDWFVRGVKEAICIRAHHPSLNRDGGRFRLPVAFDSLLTSSRLRLPGVQRSGSNI